MKLLSVAGALLATTLSYGQTRIDLRNQARAVDFSAQPGTRPIQAGSTLPSSCRRGELFFVLGAQAGETLFGCTTENTWSLISPGDKVGGCVANTSKGLHCPGEMVTGDGGVAGEVRLHELSGNGGSYISWMAPDALPTSYRLRMPASAPAGQILIFAVPSAGVAQGTWLSGVSESVYYVAAQAHQGSWLPGVGWMVPQDGTGAQISGNTDSVLPAGYLVFADGVRRSAGLHTRMPANWDTGTVSLRITWSAPSAMFSESVKFSVSTACIADGTSITNPAYNSPQVQTFVAPAGGGTVKKLDASYSQLNMGGCSPGSLLYVMVTREGTSDTITGDVLVTGAELTTGRKLQ